MSTTPSETQNKLRITRMICGHGENAVLCVLCPEELRMAIEFAETYSVAEHYDWTDQSASVSTDYLVAEGWAFCGRTGAAAEDDAAWYVNASMPNVENLCNMCTAELEEYCGIQHFKFILFLK
jgi:hypothetical protein